MDFSMEGRDRIGVEGCHSRIYGLGTATCLLETDGERPLPGHSFSQDTTSTPW